LSTCFGIKSYEYIQSCRPILVHCPGDYYTSKFFREAGAGIIVDRLDASFLENEIDEFILNYDQKSQFVVKNGLSLATQFQGSDIADKLRNEIIKVT